MLVSELVGLGDERQWSQTFAEGNILGTIEITSDGSFSAKTEGDRFLTTLIALIKKRQPQDKIAFRLLVNQFISSSLIQKYINSLLVGLYINDQIYLYSKTEGGAFLKRGKFWSEIIKGMGFVSGKIQEEDIVVITTKTFQKLLSEETVIAEFEKEEPQRAGEKLGTLLHNFDNSKGAAAIFAQFNKETEETTELTVPKIAPPPSTEVQSTIPVVASMPAASPETEIQKPDKTAVNHPNFISKLKDKLKVVLPRKQEFVQNERTISYPNKPFLSLFSSPKKRILLLVGALLIILFASIILGFGKPPNKANISEVNSLLDASTHKIEEGEGLIGLNNLRAKTVFQEAQNSLLSFKDKLTKGSKERIQAEELLNRVQNGLATITKVYKIDASVFLDLTVVKAGASAQKFALYENKLAVLDSKNISVISTDITTLASSIVGGGDKTPSPSEIATHGNNIFVLGSSGLVKIDTNSKSQEVIVKDLKVIGSPVGMVAFAGNIYVLDGKERKIWKFMALEKGYSEAKTYLAENETVNLADVKSMAIDGSVWVSGAGGVKKYTRGSEEQFGLEGLDKPLTDASVIFTDDASKFIYILDKGGGRVVVFDKKGVYDSSYEWSGISGVSDMVVSEKLKKILLLSGSNIYSIDLKI